MDVTFPPPFPADQLLNRFRLLDRPAAIPCCAIPSSIPLLHPTSFLKAIPDDRWQLRPRSRGAVVHDCQPERLGSNPGTNLTGHGTNQDWRSMIHNHRKRDL